jgi:sterol desaturase/sphingolipid hydroxylase (fatty acid hydroxylase superfamily)
MLELLGFSVSTALAQSARSMALIVLLAALLLAQRWRPFRGDAAWRRWQNLALGALSALITYLIIPLGALGVAFWAQRTGIGLFNWIAAPIWLQWLVSILILDCAIYWQHRATHSIDWLWRLHRVHHSDTAFDVTLGLRFHPLEIALSMLYKMLIVLSLGISPAIVVVYEFLLAACALLTHVDVALPSTLERYTRLLFVTPDWHRIHHSTVHAEANSNFGNFLSIWDRVFRTAIEQPVQHPKTMAIGLDQFREGKDQRLWALLRQPMRF